MRAVRLAALLLALAALPAPWFHAGGRGVPVYEIPVLFTITYYVGILVSIVALVSKEAIAPLAAAVLLSTSPVYAYFALKLTAHQVSVASGSILCVAAAALFGLEWVRGVRGGSNELLSEGGADERNGAEAFDGHPEA